MVEFPEDVLWDPLSRRFVRRQSPLLLMFTGAVIGAIFASLVWASVTRGSGPAPAAPEPSFVPVPSMEESAALTVPSAPPVLATPTSRPTPTLTPVGPVTRGTASFMAPKYGRYYLALPQGPGHRVRICSRYACLERASNDAGPDLAMQRAGRIADVSYWDFHELCRCSPYQVGLIEVSVRSIG
jgi:hypothetical protein